MTPTLTFHGAAGCVTGSCYRLKTEQGVLLVDCGMFQGSKTLKALNYGEFPFDVKEVDAVVLTHAHIDHSGLLPKLMKAGFDGPIYATTATRELCEIMLADSGGIQESEVEHLNRRNLRRGRPLVEPIYGADDAARTMELFRKAKLGEGFAPIPGVTATYWEAGHILGAASVQLTVETPDGPLNLMFSGDIGPGGRDYSPDPQGPSGVDYLILESTYGDRPRAQPDPAARRRQLADELNAAYQAGGPLLIPAFAVERSQELLADILTIIDEGQAPDADIFLDSPLAIKACRIFAQRGWNSASGENPFQDVRASERLKFLEKPWDGEGLDRLSGWHIIMAGSGMCDAGRIRRHLKRWLWNRDATVLLAGFQAKGTLGRLLAEGAKRVRIQGEDVRVSARVRTLDVYSGHADADALVRWAQARAPVRAATFLSHGEPEALQGLKGRLEAVGWADASLIVPGLDKAFELTAAGALEQEGRPRLAAQTPAALDWHNARARVLIALDERLEAAKDDEERERILAALLGDLESRPG